MIIKTFSLKLLTIQGSRALSMKQHIVSFVSCPCCISLNSPDLISEFPTIPFYSFIPNHSFLFFLLHSFILVQLNLVMLTFPFSSTSRYELL